MVVPNAASNWLEVPVKDEYERAGAGKSTQTVTGQPGGVEGRSWKVGIELGWSQPVLVKSITRCAHSLDQWIKIALMLGMQHDLDLQLSFRGTITDLFRTPRNRRRMCRIVRQTGILCRRCTAMNVDDTCNACEENEGAGTESDAGGA